MVTVRLAGAADADEIGRIQVETWRAAYTGLMPDEAIEEFDVAVEAAALAGRARPDALAGQRHLRRRGQR